MFCWNFWLSMSLHSQYKVKCYKSQAQDPDWNFKSNIFTIFEVLYNFKIKTLTNDHWRKFKDPPVTRSPPRHAQGASPPPAAGVWPGPAGPARAPGQQEVRHAAAAAPEEQLPGLVTRVTAESRAPRPGDAGPVQGELAQCVSPWCPASGQEEHCGPARCVKTFLRLPDFLLSYKNHFFIRGLYEIRKSCSDISRQGRIPFRVRGRSPYSAQVFHISCSQGRAGTIQLCIKFNLASDLELLLLETNEVLQIAPGIPLLTWLSHQRSLR